MMNQDEEHDSFADMPEEIAEEFNENECKS